MLCHGEKKKKKKEQRKLGKEGGERLDNWNRLERIGNDGVKGEKRNETKNFQKFL